MIFHMPQARIQSKIPYSENIKLRLKVFKTSAKLFRLIFQLTL